MPPNRNALIRYKTINECLSRRECDIWDLIDACSDALDEYASRKSKVSERTIRDDLRVMKSHDILGIGAPIEVRNGKYYYTDKNFSLLNKLISDDNLLDTIYDILTNPANKIEHPELEILLAKLKAIKAQREGKHRLPGMIEMITTTGYKHSLPSWGDIFRILAPKS